MALARVEIETGPNFRAALDVLELANKLFELVPEWHGEERKELAARTLGLHEMMRRSLAGEFAEKAREPSGVCVEIMRWEFMAARFGHGEITGRMPVPR